MYRIVYEKRYKSIMCSWRNSRETELPTRHFIQVSYFNDKMKNVLGIYQVDMLNISTSNMKYK